MKRNIAKNMSLGLLAILLTVLSCNKGENSTATPGANDAEPAQTPATTTEEAAEAAAAAAAKVASPVPGY